MELKDYIDLGIKRCGSVQALADKLDIISTNLTAAKAHRRSLPPHACVKLAALLGAPIETIIAASELATERKEERRQFWLPFAQKGVNLAKAASYALILASVTNFVTPSPANATPTLKNGNGMICIMSNRRTRFMLRGFFVTARDFLQDIARIWRPPPCPSSP